MSSSGGIKNSPLTYVEPVLQYTEYFSWNSYLKPTDEAAPIICFKHVALSDCWDNINAGILLEVPNTECDIPYDVYWIASVIHTCDYHALLRYEGYGNDSRKDFWINLCTEEVHPVGWCASMRKPLAPPKEVQNNVPDWKNYLVERLTGARTLPNTFYEQILESQNSYRLSRGMQLEIVDKRCISAMKLASVDEVIGGRIRLQYLDTSEGIDDFWAHEKSPLIHPIGWSISVGHSYNGSDESRNKILKKITSKTYGSDDATPSMFAKLQHLPSGHKFEVGMKLEAIDPLNLSSICVATVMKVLKENFLMIGVDGQMVPDGSDWFCYHATSPCIFPVGFCELNHIELTPPRDCKQPFKWYNYLKETKSRAAPVKLFDKPWYPKHGFKVGMKVEAVDLMEPRLICVARIAQVVGRLLKVHFDGWDDTYDQWVDCLSPDIYPVGWCEMVGYPLEGPKASLVESFSPKKKSNKKIYIKRGSKKKKKSKSSSQDLKAARVDSPCSFTSSDQTGFDTPEPMDTSEIKKENRLDLQVNTWNIYDVQDFLDLKGYNAFSYSFVEKGIDGNKFLQLTKDDILTFTNMKLGPSLLIYQLIQELKPNAK